MLSKVKNLKIKKSITSFFNKKGKLRITSLVTAAVLLTSPLAGCTNKESKNSETPDTPIVSEVENSDQLTIERQKPQEPKKNNEPDKPDRKDSDKDASKNESKKEEDSVFLSDKLKKSVKGLGSENESKDIVLPDSKTNGRDVNGVDTNGNVLSYVDGKNKYVTDDVKYDGNVYVAPNGKAYENEKEYKESIGNVNEESIKVEGKYTAPDGSVWNTKEEYDNFIMGEVITDSVNTEVISNEDSNGTSYTTEESYEEVNDNNNDANEITWEETDSSIYTVDGENWESKEAYDYYMSDEFEFDGYIAEDGTYWTSEEVYKEFMSDSSEFAADYSEDIKEETKEEEIEIGETKVEDNYKNDIIEDNQEEVKEEETKEEVKEETTVEETKEEAKEETKVEETKEEPKEETKVEETKEEPKEEETQVEENEDSEEYEYYVDENGMCWASYEDYLEVMGQNENVKQR